MRLTGQFVGPGVGKRVRMADGGFEQGADALVPMGVGVPGITVCKTHRLGEHRNDNARDPMTDSARVAIFTDGDKAGEKVRMIVSTAHRDLTSDGIVTVLPAENLLHIREFTDG